MTKQIKVLFGVSTFGCPWNIVLDRGADPSTEREGESGPKVYNGKIDITLQPIVQFGQNYA